MSFVAAALGRLVAILSLAVAEVSSYFCDGGHRCATAEQCCESGCCYARPLPPPPSPAPPPPPYRALNIFVYNHWYFWCVVCAASALVGCAWWAWRRRARLCGACCRPLARRSRASDRDSAGSCYLPPHYSRCSSFHRAPPPYNEVTSKPDMYPLVITYGDSGDKGGGGGGGSYLTVHYFRNYIIRAPGSVSATSTADSLNSSFICNASNEANSIIPPPYSCAAGCEEWRGARARPAMLRSLSTLTYMPSSRLASPPPLRIDDAPDARATVVAAAFPGLVRLDLDSSPEPVDDRSFRESLLRAASRLALRDRPRLGDYDAAYSPASPTHDAPEPQNPQGPRLGLSPEPLGECSPSSSPLSMPKPAPPSARPPPPTRGRGRGGAADAEAWRQLYERMAAVELERDSCPSPPLPTSPTMEVCRLQMPDVRVAKARPTRPSLYMPLCATQGGCDGGGDAAGRRWRGEATRSRFSLSAPTTPSGSGLMPTLLTLSQRMSGSVFSSRSGSGSGESDPLLLQDGGPF